MATFLLRLPILRLDGLSRDKVGIVWLTEKHAAQVSCPCIARCCEPHSRWSGQKELQFQQSVLALDFPLDSLAA